jgi:predicted Zn-dependent protease with MMP-like domain
MVKVTPSHIVLYEKNIEAVCSNEDEVREENRLTVIHELALLWHERRSTQGC